MVGIGMELQQVPIFKRNTSDYESSETDYNIIF